MSLAWDERLPLECVLHVVRDEVAGVYTITGALEGDGTAIPINDVRLLLVEGIAVTDGRAFAINPSRVASWMQQLHERGPLRVPLDQVAFLREALVASGAAEHRRAS